MSTYAQAKLAVDVGKETALERKQYEAAVRARERQEKNQGIFGSLGSLIGGFLFGPIGMVLGGALGRHGTDAMWDAEDHFISTHGKFSQSEIRTLNQSLKDYDKASDDQHLQALGMDLISAWGMAGMGDDASWTSFGGKEAGAKGWSVGGKEAAKEAGSNAFQYYLKNPEFYKSVVGGGSGSKFTATEILKIMSQGTSAATDKDACEIAGGAWDPGSNTCNDK